MKKLFHLAVLLIACYTLTACYYSHPNKLDHWIPTDQSVIDSVNFRIAHHYWKGFIFETTDSLTLNTYPASHLTDALAELRVETANDSIGIRKKEKLIVRDILYIPADTIDTIWVKVSHDQLTTGWIHEQALLKTVVPDAPISRFIRTFSDRRTLIFVTTLCIVGLLSVIVALLRRQASQRRQSDGKDSHISNCRRPGSGWCETFHTFYPTLLGLSVSGTTALYCSIQHFVPSTWVEFYFHPTLNPFHPEIPWVMKVFLGAVWLLAIIILAVVIDFRKRKGVLTALAHLSGLACTCIVLYLVLTFTIPLLIGYVLLAAYWVYTIWKYAHQYNRKFLCGQCGQPLPDLGNCPYCGAENK